MRRSKIIMSLVWILLAVFVCIRSFKLNIGTLSSPDPGFMPFVCGAFIGLFGFMILSQEWRNRKKEIGWGAVNWGKIFMILIGIIIYATLVEKLGYLLTTFFVMILFFKVLGIKKWLFIILYSFLSTLSIYLIFDVGLQCYFPKGILRI